MSLPRLFRLLGAGVLAAVFVACSAPGPSSPGASSQGAQGNGRTFERSAVRPSVDFSPDSAATVDSVFFTSPAPREAVPLDDGFSEALTVSVVGNVENGRAQWALRIASAVPDLRKLSPRSYVGVASDSLVMFRGHTWRTLNESRSLLVAQRFVPLYPRDVERLVQSDTLYLLANNWQFRLSEDTRRDLDSLVASTPDSLVPGISTVANVSTAYKLCDVRPMTETDITRNLARVVEYPERAQRQGITGVVELRFVVNRRGEAVHTQIVDPAHPLLNEAATEAVSRLRFEPGRNGGQPVPTLNKIPVTFQLK